MITKNCLKINHLLAAFLFVVLWLSTGSCKDNKADYINLSANSFTFNADGKEELKINVEASQDWSVEYVGKWVIEKGKDANSIMLGATQTQNGSVRSAQVIFRAGEAVETVNLTQLGTTITFSLLEPTSVYTIMSPGGKYIGGVTSAMEGSKYKYTPFTIHIATGRKEEKPAIMDVSHVASSISDEGFFVIYEEAKGIAKYYDENNNLTTMNIPASFESPQVSATSADGNILVGYAKNTTDKRYYPIKWTGGTPKILDIPEESLFGELIDVGVYARGCSADGSVVYGAIADDQSALIWKGDNKVKFVGENLIKKHIITVNTGAGDFSYLEVDRPIYYADCTSISMNGKYLATTFLEITAPNKAVKVLSYPAYYDVENETLTYVKNLPDGFEDASGITISNDGILSFVCPATAFTDGYVYDIHSRTTMKATTFLRDEYGVIFTGNTSAIYQFAPDRKAVFGMNMLLQGSAYQYWYIHAEE
ncbi:BACON domain-containing protein [Bacteroides sp. GM023]|uniref:BACON domain-containing protein n=1 Tax=Bacteroides sp. GM023 TaxID=2723058 RepID=UPI00168B8D3C|nr:BACON domain-containing protein [Bacteroides sp. GM023]MBD3592114.1 BACON domain-containing protein [Bacteroides sp. GM023]